MAYEVSSRCFLTKNVLYGWYLTTSSDFLLFTLDFLMYNECPDCGSDVVPNFVDAVWMRIQSMRMRDRVRIQ